MITERQEKLLDFLVKEYLSTSQPVSSFALKKSSGLDVSPATVRNDLQELTKAGYIKQPHISAGRVPTKKAYKYFAIRIESSGADDFEDFVAKQIKHAHEQIEHEIKMAEDIMQCLEQDNLFEILKILDTWHKKTRNL